MENEVANPLARRPDSHRRAARTTSEVLREKRASLEATKDANRAELEAAALTAARSAWKEATGREWSEDDTDTFSDRVLTEHERRALEVTRQLHQALVATAQFAQDYQRVPGTMEVVGPDRRPLPFSETAHIRTLLQVVERDLPALDGRTHDVEGRIVAVNRGIRTDVSTLSTIRSLEVAETGWHTKMRGRVVSLLGDLSTSVWASLPDFRKQLPGVGPWSTKKSLAETFSCTLEELGARVAADEVEENAKGHVRPTMAGNEAIAKLIARGEVEQDSRGFLRHRRGYWLQLGFREPPTPHLMACASLLLGCRSRISPEALAKGASIEHVLASERKAIERIAATTWMAPLASGWYRRAFDPDRLPFGEHAREALKRFEARRAELEGASDAARLDEFMRRDFVPWYNRAATEDRLCEECFASFEFIHPRQTFCSDECSARRRNRGRPHDGLSEIARAERAKRRIGKQIAAHAEECSTCRHGEPCGRRERLLGYAEPLTVPGS